jgi:propionate CoA-transferase
MVHDGDVVAFSDLAGNARLAAMHYAIKQLFSETGHPRHLTLISAGGQGGRGKIPSTLEEIGVEDLCIPLISGHLETYKTFLRFADQNKMELQCIPLGVCSLLFNQQAHGKNWIITETGKGTFVDPECGRGTPVGNGQHSQLVTAQYNKLRFEMPFIKHGLHSSNVSNRGESTRARSSPAPWLQIVMTKEPSPR